MCAKWLARLFQANESHAAMIPGGADPPCSCPCFSLFSARCGYGLILQSNNLIQACMVLITRWLYLNCKYRVSSLPNDPDMLEKIAKGLQIPLAFTYRASGLDAALAEQRIQQSLNSFRWIVPLAIAGLCFVLIVAVLVLSLPFLVAD